MNITAFSNRWLNRLYKCIAILLVVVAVLISAMRLLLPYMQNYRAELQNHINTTYNTNIHIGALTMDWQKVGPVLVANNVRLVDTESAVVFIEHLDIKVNFWRSIQHRTLVTRGLTLDGAKVVIDTTKLANNGISTEDSSNYDRLSDIFLLHVSNFSLTNSQVVVRTASGDKKLALKHLNWLNQGNRHRASGEVLAQGLATNTAKVLVDFTGSEVADMSGQIYLQGQRVNVTPWLDRALILENDKTYSELNWQSWLTIDNGLASNLLVSIEDSKLRWIVDEQEHEVQLKEALLNADILGDRIVLNSAPINVEVSGQAWQPIYLNADVIGDEVDAYLSGLDIAGVSELLPLFVDSPKLSATLAQLSPSGQLSDIHIRRLSGEFAATAELIDYQQNYANGIPGVGRLNASVIAQGKQVIAQLKASDSQLDFAEHFKQPIAFTELAANLSAQFGDNGLNLNVDSFDFVAPNIALAGKVNIAVPKGGNASMALLANIERANVQQVNLYYPHRLMGDDLVNYLDRSLIDGQISSGQVLFNGAFRDFPFNEQQGIFVVDAELSNATFAFDTKWPAIEQMDANLNFTNNGMLITAREGSLTGLNVAGVTAEIADLSKEQLLLVSADINQESPANVTQLMQQSPLKKSVGEVLTTLQISNPISGKFDLSLPLKDIKGVMAKGYVDFIDNQLELTKPEMSFANVNGRLTYQNDIIDTQDLSLKWRNMPLSIEVTGRDQQDYYQTLLAIKGDWAAEEWLAQVPDPLKPYADGQLNWLGQVALNSHRGGGFSYEADITSDLLTTALNLPAPYGKAKQSSLPLTAKVTGQLDKSTVSVSAGEELSFYGVLSHSETQFQRSHLVLGNDTMLLPMNGFHITTKLAFADIQAWQPFIDDILKSLPKSSKDNKTASLFPAPERIRGNIDQLDVLGQSLTNVSFNLLDEKNWWLLRLNAKEARSEIKFFPNWHEQGLEVDADFIHLAADMGDQGIADEGAKTSANEASDKNQTTQPPVELTYQERLALFNSIPKLDVVCDSCKLGKLDFGQVSFQLKHNGDKLNLENFKAKRDKSKLELAGFWQLSPEQSMTELTGKINIKELEREFDKFDYASVIKDSGMAADYDVYWQGGPTEFSLAKLNGQASIDIDDGYLSEVSDKGARIFSVLSLQSLVRKLTLDFRDIFSDGMFYTYIRADAQVKDGVLYTDNMRMKGAAGDLSVKGNTELAAGILDYRMSYKPNLTSSLPVLAWIATLNPAVFLAGVAIDEVFTSKVVSEFNFELTGSVNDPSFKEVNRKSRDVSVGRSTPPTFVENKPTMPAKPAEPEDIMPEGQLDEFIPPTPLDLNLNLVPNLGSNSSPNLNMYNNG
ncbi:YhdP family protein [Thalassotalea euphylliae]|uniref:TIGR02099 family protein n=1 Tax=Thalassotalea euphylliae TaxID=1655234 RepID=A0A3E0U6R5_9GAMM|nr:YhdP family protein [Thalassotalea euphylliae]REL31835.1 TIGR02099 family protein [Thalassotalea euphylliae]